MSVLHALLVLAAAGISGYAVTRLLLPVLRRHVMDTPNERSSHKVPTPRGGGIGIVAGAAVGVAVVACMGAELPGWKILSATFIVAFIGFVDDRWTLRALPRFAGVLAAATLLVALPSGGLAYVPFPEPLGGEFIPWVGIAGAVLWLVAVPNLYNFLDGIDGYAGTQGLIAGLALWAFDPSGPMAGTALAVAGACAGFLVLNWHPAKIFMGDVASTSLGFVFAALPFALPRSQQADGIFVIGFVLWFFLMDAVFTIVRRAIAGEKLHEAHRSHLYQRLVTAGMPHNRVVQLVMGAAVVLSAAIVWSTAYDGSSSLRWGAVVLAVAMFVVYAVFTTWYERRRF